MANDTVYSQDHTLERTLEEAHKRLKGAVRPETLSDELGDILEPVYSLTEQLARALLEETS